MYSWLLVLVFLMASGGPGAKRRRSSAQQSALGSQEEDWEAITAEVRCKKTVQDKGKAKDTRKSKEKGKGKDKEKVVESEQAGERQNYVRGGDRPAGCISIREAGDASPVRAEDVPVDPSRRSMYSSSIYRDHQRQSAELERLAAGQAQMATEQAKLATDQERLITQLGRLNKKYVRISGLLRILCGKMGCGSSEMPPVDTDSE